jgi:hypothetical protein
MPTQISTTPSRGNERHRSARNYHEDQKQQTEATCTAIAELLAQGVLRYVRRHASHPGGRTAKPDDPFAQSP